MTEKEKKMAKRSVSRISAYKHVFSGPEGELVLQDLMSTHFINMSTFLDADPTKMIFREGERNVILRIFKMLKIDIKDMQERIKENEV